jgi:AcrR family transcriptional regulator
VHPHRAPEGGTRIGKLLDTDTAPSVASAATSSDDGAESDEWHRAPRQRRSRVTLDLFLRAVEELLEDRTFDEITVADITAHADRSAGSFYARFGDKDAALHSLHAEYLEDDLPFLEEFLAPETWTGVPLAEILREAVTLFVVAYLQPRPSFRPVILRAASDPTFHRQVAEAATVAEQAWRQLLISRRDEIGHPDPGRAAGLCFRHIFVVLDHELLFGPMLLGGESTTESMIDDLTAVVSAVLEVRSAP